MKKISADEMKRIRLEILKEIDKFCRGNNLVYFLAYGTLLGAVRHKGFIPWDDDADVMMPRKDLEILKRTFTSDLFKYSDYDNEAGYELHFPRITHKQSFNKMGLIAKSYGVFVDVYPIDNLPENKEEIDAFFQCYKFFSKIKCLLRRFRNLIVKIMPISNVPMLCWMSRKLDNLTKKYENISSSKVFVTDPRIYEGEIFEDVVEVDFEGQKFYAPKGFDSFLKTTYGDYMQEPPINQRVAYHKGHYYWK